MLLLLDGDQKNLDSAVAALEPIAKEYVTKWQTEEKEQVNYTECTNTYLWAYSNMPA